MVTCRQRTLSDIVISTRPEGGGVRWAVSCTVVPVFCVTLFRERVSSTYAATRGLRHSTLRQATRIVIERSGLTLRTVFFFFRRQHTVVQLIGAGYQEAGMDDGRGTAPLLLLPLYTIVVSCAFKCNHSGNLEQVVVLLLYIHRRRRLNIFIGTSSTVVVLNKPEYIPGVAMYTCTSRMPPKVS